jgi:ADP-ribosylglycohydrolase
VVGNMLGKPVEGWTQDAIRVALTANGEWPLRDYFPGRAEGSIGLDDYVVCWPETTRGNINGSSRDDDVDYTILNLHVLERHGQAASTTAFASAWLELLPYLQTFTAERVAIRNLLRGDDPAVAAAYRNPYREFIGAAIRADVFGYVHPGDPASAARLAYRDAVLSHRGNGVYSEMWCAALVSSAFTARSADEVLSNSLKVVPRRSRLHQAVQEVLDAKRAGLTWDDTMERIAQSWHGHNWVHALVNAAVLSAGIAFGEGNFDDTVTLTVMGGLDTDSNGATAGSVAGILATDIDSRWVDPLKDTVRSAVFGYDGISLSALAGRTAAVAEQFRSGGPTTSAHAAASLPPAAW